MENQTFESDQVSFTITRQQNCVVHYKAKASTALVAKAKEKALHSLAKNLSIPGFRKGKAPTPLIEKNYPQQLDEEWKKKIADLSFAACQKTQFTPLADKDTRINFQVNSFALDEGADMLFSFESEPVVPAVDLDKIELKEIFPEEVSAQKIDEKITEIQMFFTEWKLILDRPLTWGDHATIDVTVIEESPEKKVLDHARFEMSKEKLADWMKELLIGMRIGDEKEGVSQPDADASDETKASTPPKKVRVTLHKIETGALPSVDDTLAQKVGAKDVADMRKKLQTVLTNQAQKAVSEQYRSQLNDHLYATYAFDLPTTLVQREIEFRLRQLLANPTYLREFSALNEEAQKKIVGDLEAQARRALILFYLARKVIQDQNITVSPQELKEEEKTPLDMMFNNSSGAYHPQQDSQEQKNLAFSRLILRKAEDYLIEKARFVAVPPPPKEDKPLGD